MIEITEEDIGKSFEASQLGVTFFYSEHRTVTILDVWVRSGYKYIRWVCNENESIGAITMRKFKKPMERPRRVLPPSFP